MTLDNITLEQWLKDPPDESFKNNRRVDYYTKYSSIKNYLIENVYAQVTPGANLKEPDMFFNDHGIEHVENVIDMISELVKSIPCKLNAKEAYFLLCATLIHDIGNVFGRVNHEKNLHDILVHIQHIFSSDTAEQQIIQEIARAHGGRTERGTKDTIYSHKDEKFFGNERIKARLISAILRFADEIADNKKRASHLLLNNGSLKNNKSEIFHAYSACVDSVLIDHEKNIITIQYHIPIQYLERSFNKLGIQTYLIDEIYARLMKMYTENLYTQKYMAKFIHINKIEVNIEFIRPSTNPFDINTESLTPIKFTLENKGYPEEPQNGIYDLCPDLNRDGVKFNGEYYYQKLKGAGTHVLQPI